tara:strand:+ start:1786 stop:1971 length:186 start_codon:yes stop_codon:yes gene_type:complete
MSNEYNDILLDALVECYMEAGLTFEEACEKAKEKFDKHEPFPDEEHRDDSMFAGPEIVEDE